MPLCTVEKISLWILKEISYMQQLPGNSAADIHDYFNKYLWMPWMITSQQFAPTTVINCLSLYFWHFLLTLLEVELLRLAEDKFTLWPMRKSLNPINETAIMYRATNRIWGRAEMKYIYENFKKERERELKKWKTWENIKSIRVQLKK